MIYLDNAATSFPKPESVTTAVTEALATGGNAARGHHHLAGRGARLIEETRSLLASLLNAEDPSRVAFAFNATDALNMAIKGFVQPGDHVITTQLEHNSVLRPLNGLKTRGVIDMSVSEVGENGVLDPGAVEALIRSETRLAVMTYVSNVLGTIQPVAEVAEICGKHGIPLLVDAAQATGELPIDVQALGVAMLAFPGHKGLLGPQGCGGLYVRPGIELAAWREGGTGTQSKLTEHPDEMPHRLEAGTHNLPALAGLAAGVRFIQERGVAELRDHQLRLLRQLVEGLEGIGGVTLYGDLDPARKAGVASFNVAGMDCSDVGAILDQSFEIVVRTGLHCAAPTHRAIGTFPSGTVRASPGFATTEDEIQTSLSAIEQIADAALP